MQEYAASKRLAQYKVRLKNGETLSATEIRREVMSAIHERVVFAETYGTGRDASAFDTLIVQWLDLLIKTEHYDGYHECHTTLQPVIEAFKLIESALLPKGDDA